MTVNTILSITVSFVFLLIILFWSYFLLEIRYKIFDENNKNDDIIKAIYKAACTTLTVVIALMIGFLLNKVIGSYIF